MVLSKRTKISIAQLLLLLKGGENLLLEKHGYMPVQNPKDVVVDLCSELVEGTGDLRGLIEEIVRTQRTLRYGVEPRYSFDERWEDLRKCMLLDGYRIEGDAIHKVEPQIEGVETLEDDLTKELRASGLPQVEEIINKIDLSVRRFNEEEYNECISDARLALNVLVTTYAKEKGWTEPEDQSKCWGTSLASLKKEKGFITEHEEAAITSVYTFISDGAHRILGFTGEEYARFARNLVISICYYITKKINGAKSNT